MAERLPEPPQQRARYEPVEPAGEVARKNVALGLALFGIALLMAAGAVAVSLIYLQFD
jgi:hypothetical protein